MADIGSSLYLFFCLGETSEKAPNLEEAPVFHQGQIPEIDEQPWPNDDQGFCWTPAEHTGTSVSEVLEESAWEISHGWIHWKTTPGWPRKAAYGEVLLEPLKGKQLWKTLLPTVLHFNTPFWQSLTSRQLAKERRLQVQLYYHREDSEEWI